MTQRNFAQPSRLQPTQPLKPFYMWAGGKSRLLSRYVKVWPTDTYDTYVEPFFGGGAVFGWLVAQSGAPSSYILGDINIELITMLTDLRDDADGFIVAVRQRVKEYLRVGGKEARKRWYYQQREDYWADPSSPHLYVLMRLGFNGIWQTCKDSNGLFGTPAGLLNHTNFEAVFNEALLRNWAQTLQQAELYSGDYRGAPLPETPALIYLDPPYRNSYTNYSTGWGDADQKQLAAWFRTQRESGHKVLLANRCVEGDSFFEDLLGDIADFHYFDVIYTAGRRRRTEDGFEAKPAREFLAVST